MRWRGKALLLAALLALPPGLPARAATLADELARLEKAAQTAATPAQRREALAARARLLQLAGDREAAADAWARAADADPAQRDDAALLAAARLYISLAEYDKARAAIDAVFTGQDPAVFDQARLAEAELAAFMSGDLAPLTRLTTDSVFAALLPSLYYTLWRLSGNDDWKARLLTVYPGSPEALAARDAAAVTLSASPQWLLFPGRAGFTLVSPAVSTPPAATAAAGTPSGGTAAAAGAEAPAALLQTGLYAKEENAQNMMSRLKTAGFTPQLSRRTVNGAAYWMVAVPAGADINRTILALKTAGFESFPVFE